MNVLPPFVFVFRFVAITTSNGYALLNLSSFLLPLFFLFPSIFFLLSIPYFENFLYPILVLPQPPDTNLHLYSLLYGRAGLFAFNLHGRLDKQKRGISRLVVANKLYVVKFSYPSPPYIERSVLSHPPLFLPV